MSHFRSILLQLDASSAAAARLDAAWTLALRQEAALSALYVAAPPRHPLQLALAEGPAALSVAADGAAGPELARRRFHDVSTRGGPAMHWLEPARIDPVDAFCHEALYADLLVLGPAEPAAAPEAVAPDDFVETALLRSGRPALVLPAGHAGAPFGGGALVGWNATPAAAHAVSAALPWLKAARQVHVLQASDAGAPAQPEGLDIVRYLGFHGIVARLHRQRATPREAGDVLLSAACDLGADLLVMGCDSRGRAREAVLGGATRTVLRTLTLPVLMAH